MDMVDNLKGLLIIFLSDLALDGYHIKAGRSSGVRMLKRGTVNDQAVTNVH